MSRNSAKVLDCLKKNEPNLTQLVINDPLYSDHDLRKLLHALTNNTHLVKLDLRNSNITDAGVKLLLKHTRLLSCQVATDRISHTLIVELNEHIERNNRARRLLFVEQAIVIAQAKKQNALPLAYLPKEVVILILVNIATTIGFCMQHVQFLCNLIFTNINPAQVGLRKWHTAVRYQGNIIKIFKPWQSPTDYIEQVLRYTPGCNEILAALPELKEMITTPFRLKILKVTLPKLLEQFLPQTSSLFQTKRFTKKLLFDLFIQEHFIDSEKRLKQNKQISIQEDIQSAFWNYAKSLAQTMHQAGVKTVFYQENDSTTQMNIGSENIWRPFFDRKNPRLALLQTACCVIELGPNQFAFIDDELFVYFVSLSLLDGLARTGANLRPR